MSWTVSTEGHPASEIREAIDALELPLAEDAPQEQLDQLRDAKEQAKGALDQGVGGDSIEDAEGRWFRVDLSGHAADDSREGTPGDHLVVKVEQIEAPS